MIPGYYMCFGMWTYVLYRKDCNSYLYDSIIPSWPAKEYVSKMILTYGSIWFYGNTGQYWTVSQAINEYYRIVKEKVYACFIDMIYCTNFGIMILIQTIDIYTAFEYVYVYYLLTAGFSFTEWRLI